MSAMEVVRDALSGWPIGGGYYATSVGVDEAHDMAQAALKALADMEPTEAEVEAAAAAFRADGWTCEGDPLGLDECDQCGPATRRIARAALRAASEARA